MGWVTLLAIYFVIWWITIFVVLPFGVQRQTDGIEGQSTGAPQSPGLLLKMGINSVLAFIIWLGIFLIDKFDLITLSDIGIQ